MTKKIEIEHDGGDQIVYIPAGEDPEPLYLSENDDLVELVNGRERVMLESLLQYALRRLERS